MIFKSKIFFFSLIKFLAINLIAGIVLAVVSLIELENNFGIRHLNTKEISSNIIIILTSLAVVYIAYKESSWIERCRYSTVALTSFIASLLLFINPYFWRESAGHPSLPNWISIPPICVIMILLSFSGHWYYNKKHNN